MKHVRDIGNALLVAFVSIGLILGALSISLVEFAPEAAPTVTDSLFASPAPLTATSTLKPTLTPTLEVKTSTPTITATFTNTPTPPASCQPPAGWFQITIQAGDTLDSIAAQYRVDKNQVSSANCLLSSDLIIGSRLYVPPAPANTAAVCVRGSGGWVNNYLVQPGDSLYRIGYDYYTTLELMRRVNCRVSDTIFAGERLWVPNVATRTPILGVTSTNYPTVPFTETPPPFTATIAPTNTPVPPTNTPEPTLTDIPIVVP